MKIIKIAILFLLICFTQLTHASPTQQLVIFGDSLSDNGNFYSATFKFVPKQPYYAGRFSNGPTWAEDVSAALSKDHSTLSLNMAYGGATAKPSRNDLAWQVSAFLNKHNVENKDGCLFVIWIGSNDYLPAKGNTNTETNEVIASIKKQVDILVEHGAKHFLIIGLPDLGKTPLAKLVGLRYQTKIHALSVMHNQKLLTMMAAEKTTHPNIDFISFDPNPLFAEAVRHPQLFGIKNSQDACFEGDTFMYAVLSDKSYGKINLPINHDAVIVCKNQDEHLFWDHVHPTRVVHKRIAEAVLAKMKAGKSKPR
ncbi:MAG: SGNH/GDSL hydrolase family protein [Gammaproteobacteria bacterium]